jgi:acyl-CoA dehydrogenase
MFFQAPPQLANQFDDDRVLRAYLTRVLPPDALAEVSPVLRELGGLAGGELYAMQREDRLNEPVLTQWDPWGNRIDHIELTPLWKAAARVAARTGVVAHAYDGKQGALNRVVQLSLLYLFAPSTDVYSCPLAMTDGAARTLLTHGNTALTERAFGRLTSRDPDAMWTSGQWMTERTGGSDVGISETVAKRDGDRWRLHGTKWFTSATTSEMALTLARPEGNGAGGKGLALFYVEQLDEQGRRNNILVNRLKDKLGTRKVPTAELTLDGALATPVVGLDEGVRAITPMLNVTRTWNAICAAAGMRRGLALAQDYARRRVAFGAPLADKPLHLETLAGLAAEAEAGFLLAFFVGETLGKVEAGEASDHDRALLRLGTPAAKAVTGKQAVVVASEVLECFGGAGYVEDTGLPQLLRDAQVLPIWEGTTNVLSLDALRALGKEGEGLRVWREEIVARTAGVRDSSLVEAAQTAVQAVNHAGRWLAATFPEGRPVVEAGARGFLLTVGRAMALALLCEQAQWSLDQGDPRSLYAARRFAHSAIDQLGSQDLDEARALALG